MYNNEEIIKVMILVDREYDLQKLSRIGIKSLANELSRYSCVEEDKKMFCLEYASRVRFEIKREVEWFIPINKMREYNKFNNDEFAVKRTIHDIYSDEKIEDEEVSLPDHLESHMQAINSYMLNKDKILKKLTLNK